MIDHDFMLEHTKILLSSMIVPITTSRPYIPLVHRAVGDSNQFIWFQEVKDKCRMSGGFDNYWDMLLGFRSFFIPTFTLSLYFSFF